MFEQFYFVPQYAPEILRGLQYTLAITLFGVLFGLALGLLLAIGDLYGPLPLRVVIAGYVEFFRGSPLFVQLFIAVYTIPYLINLPINHYLLAFLIFGLNSGAYQKGYVKGAMETVLSDQMDAGLSTGMSKAQTLWHVVIPQSLRIVIPAWTNEFCSLTKSSSALGYVGIFNLTAVGIEIISIHYFPPLQVWIVIGAIYLIWITAVASFADWLYKRVKVPGIELDVLS